MAVNIVSINLFMDAVGLSKFACKYNLINTSDETTRSLILAIAHNVLGLYKGDEKCS